MRFVPYRILLKKAGITAVYHNLTPDTYVNFGKTFAAIFRPELLKGWAEM